MVSIIGALTTAYTIGVSMIAGLFWYSSAFIERKNMRERTRRIGIDCRRRCIRSLRDPQKYKYFKNGVVRQLAVASELSTGFFEGLYGDTPLIRFGTEIGDNKNFYKLEHNNLDSFEESYDKSIEELNDKEFNNEEFNNEEFNNKEFNDEELNDKELKDNDISINKSIEVNNNETKNNDNKKIDNEKIDKKKINSEKNKDNEKNDEVIFVKVSKEKSNKK
jgi:hypothetical protein